MRQGHEDPPETGRDLEAASHERSPHTPDPDGPFSLSDHEKKAVLQALRRMAPGAHDLDDLEWIESGRGAAWGKSKDPGRRHLVVWFSKESQEEPLTLWYEPASGDYLTPSEFYEVFEEIRDSKED